MKKPALTFTIIMALAMASHAATVTWTDSDGDHDWGNPNNWSTLALPTDADTATFPASIGGSATYEVHMNGDRNTYAVVFSGTGFPIINGADDSLTISGYVSGSKGAVINTKLVFTQDVAIRSADSWISTITLAGGAQGAVTVSSTGNQNNRLTIGGGLYAVSNTVFQAGGGTIKDCVITNVNVTLGCTFSDGDGNRTGLSILSTANISNTVIATVKNAGGLTFKNDTNPDAVSHTVVKNLLHRQGNLGLRNELWGGTNLVTIQSFVCEPGAFVKVTNSKSGTPAFNPGVNAGFIIPGAVNTNGTYKPNFMIDYYLTKINEHGAIVTCDPSTDYTVAPAASYDPTKMYRQNAAADITLTQDIEVWAWLVNASGDMALNLGDFDMTVGSGNMVFNGSGVRSVNSTGGRLVFGGDDVIIYAAGSTTGSLTFSAPIAWRSPTGSTVQYPSLIFSGTGLPSVIFEGDDEITDYHALNAEAGKSISSIIFAGPSDRTFHGPITGRNRIYQRGTGTLTFSGADNRRWQNFYAESGTTVLAHNEAPQVQSVTNGAVCIVADGIVPTRRVSVYNGGIFCMEGDTASVGYQPVYPGGRLEGGVPGDLGTFKATGDFEPYGDFTMGLKIGETSASLISLAKFIIPPVGGGATITVSVADVSNGSRLVRTGDVFTVATATSFTNTSYPMNFAVVNESPGSLDTSAAQVTYNSSAKTITISGIRSLRGTVILVK